ncbi:uncharacterized protein LOC142345820 isoform X2 [Convolutriloba macropyga]|uniref:uncharacterized protein LOC142345820 isoform X2 n=1 Tax=Convolutriloba macropyga TaxID=536237 RepID=UPI003F51DE6C
MEPIITNNSSCDNIDLCPCSVVYGAHPQSVFVLVITIIGIAFILAIFAFFLGRCSVKMEAVRRRKFLRSFKRPELSRRISDRFAVSLRRNSVKSNTGDRCSAVGLLRTPDELRQHNPPREVGSCSIVGRPATFHEFVSTNNSLSNKEPLRKVSATMKKQTTTLASDEFEFIPAMKIEAANFLYEDSATRIAQQRVREELRLSLHNPYDIGNDDDDDENVVFNVHEGSAKVNSPFVSDVQLRPKNSATVALYGDAAIQKRMNRLSQVGSRTNTGSRNSMTAWNSNSSFLMSNAKNSPLLNTVPESSNLKSRVRLDSMRSARSSSVSTPPLAPKRDHSLNM